MNSETFVSVVIPVYGHQNPLDELYQRLRDSLGEIGTQFEIIFVNDCSPDNPWGQIVSLSTSDPRVKGINLSRNFGQHYAITAGVDYARGDWVVVMDCDLQDPPEAIKSLYDRAQEGYDIVFARRLQRQDGIFKRLGSKIFHKLFSFFTDTDSDSSIANFSIASSKVISSFRRLREQHRAYPVFVRWLGFKTGYVGVQHAKRLQGKSGYTLSKLVKLAVDNIVSQSNKPLRLSIGFGFLVSIASLLYGGWLIIRHAFFYVSVSGWTSMMVSLYFLAGLIFANLGVIGLYLGRIYEEVKHRPLYVIEDIVGCENGGLDIGK